MPVKLRDHSLSRKKRSQSASNKSRWQILFLIFSILVSIPLSYLLEDFTISLHPPPPPPVIDRGDLIRHAVVENDSFTYTTMADLSTSEKPLWVQTEIFQTVPVVLYYAKPGDLPCNEYHSSTKVVKQARKLNDLVYFIGHPECESFYKKMNVNFEPFSTYEEVYSWFVRNIGPPIDIHVKWFILKYFMERHNFPRVFFLSTEVLLFANVTEVAAWLYPDDEIVLPIRWPSIRPPMRVHQYKSTAVSTHVALLSYEGSVDICLFVFSVFRLALFGGNPNSKKLVMHKYYADMALIGLYTFAECWMEDLNPPCISEPHTGITPERAQVLRSNFKPKFQVRSFCQPRQCQNSTWSSQGLCVFDNNFSITTLSQYFKFHKGDKNPTSMDYAFYVAWMKDEQTLPLQFLGVHFQGEKKDLLLLDEEYEDSWGGHVF